MPTEPPRLPSRAWLAGCVVHHEPPAGAPRMKVKVNGQLFQALCSLPCCPRGWSPGLSCPSPAHRVTISAAPGTWPNEVGIVRDLPVTVLLGRDWLGFDRLLATATQPASPARNRRNRKSTRGPRRRPGLLASDSTRDGEFPSQNTNLYFVSQQVSGGGAFAKEQQGDDRLKHFHPHGDIDLSGHPVHVPANG